MKIRRCRITAFMLSAALLLGGCGSTAASGGNSGNNSREVMQKRKSIRQYLTTPVEEEKVKAMIEAAILAPTWKNAQEIRYYVAVSEEKRQAVLDAPIRSGLTSKTPSSL